MANSFKFTDNSPAVLSAMKSQVEAALTECGLRAVGYAQAKAPVGEFNIPENKPYTGGSLKKSLTFKVKGQTCYVGTNIKAKVNYYDKDGKVKKTVTVPYAIYQELGTGIYAEDGKGKQSPWYFYNKKGEKIRMVGMEPKHFLRNAIQDHREEYIRVLKKWLKGG